MSIKKYKTKSGIKYMFTEHLGINPITGKRVLVTRRGFPSKKEAQSKLNELKYEFDNGIFDGGSFDTFGNVYEMWRDIYKDRVKESTLNKTDSYFKTHILPVFEDVKIKDITPMMCQDFANNVSKKYKNYNKVYMYASAVYEHAFKMGITSTPNPFKRIFAPKVDRKPKDKDFFDGKEIIPFLENIKSEKWRVYFRVLAFTGLRRGEGLALQWNDIDFKEKTLSIQRTLTLGESNVQYVDTPKTQSGNRIIALDDETLRQLRNWKAKQKVISLKGWVFPNERGRMTMVTKPYQALKKALKEQGIDKNITVHSFRHTHCSLLFEAGWSLKEVQERLGWSDANTCLNVYYHVTESRKVKAVDDFLDYVKTL